MLHAGCARSICHIFSLLHFSSRSYRPKILNTVDSVSPSHRALEAFHVIHVALHNFYSAFGKFLRSSSARSSRQPTNSPAISQEILQDGASLFPRRAAHQNSLVHIAHDLVPKGKSQSAEILFRLNMKERLFAPILPAKTSVDRVSQDKKGARSA